MDQITTAERAKLGPDNNFTAKKTHTYIYIYMAKAPSGAYILGPNLLKTGEKWQFWV